jgi:hypothetical protein
VTVALYVALALALGAAGAQSLVHDAEQRARTGRVQLAVDAFVPFGGGPSGWSGLVRIQNVGSDPVSVLGLDLPAPVVVLDLYRVPIRIEGRASGTVTMRLRLDCTAEATSHPAPTIEVLTRTVHRQARAEQVAFPALTALVSQLEREQCGSQSGPVSDRVTLTYEGSELRRGALVTRVLARNADPSPVDVIAVTGSTGWPGVVRTQPPALPATVPAGGAVQLELQWDVAACPHLQPDGVVSSLRMVLISPAVVPLVETVDLGAPFARDFFRYYQRACS